MNIETALRSATDTLDEAGVIEPRREAASLLAFILKTDRTFLIAHPEHQLAADKSILFKSVVRRRANREPFQHIVGKQEFYGLDFAVTPDVLVPRPETELLVDTAIREVAEESTPRICEIGVGSGCIVVSILKHLPNATAVAVDVSKVAIEVARQNAETHGVGNRIAFRDSNVYENVTDEQFDAIVSNPPYIAVADFETLQPEVRDFDPRAALTDEGDGLTIIRSIIEGAPHRLKPNGLLIIEIGYRQAESVKRMFQNPRWEAPTFELDFQQIPRIVRARLAKL